MRVLAVANSSLFVRSYARFPLISVVIFVHVLRFARFRVLAVSCGQIVLDSASDLSAFAEPRWQRTRVRRRRNARSPITGACSAVQNVPG